MSVSYSRLQYRDTLILFTISLSILLLFVIRIPTNGDTYTYSHSILTFDGGLPHFGYYILGFTFHFLLKIFGISPLETLNYMSAFFASVAVVIMYLLTFELTENRFQSYLAAAILFFSGAFWYFSEHGEVYIPQLACTLFSLLFALYKRPLSASFFFILAVTITPTSCLVAPALIYISHVRQYSRKESGFLLLPFVLCFTALLLWDFSRIIDLIKWGVYSPKVFFGSFSYKALAVKIGYSLTTIYGKSFNVFSFLALLGLVLLFTVDKQLFGLILTLLLPFSLYIFNLGLLSGDHLIISFIAISFLASYCLVTIFNKIKLGFNKKLAMAGFLLIFHCLSSNYLFIAPAKRDSFELKKLINELGVHLEHNAIIISDYDFGMAFWYLTAAETDFFLLTGRPDEFFRVNCSRKEMCSEVLHDKFWINLPHLPACFNLPGFTEVFNGRRVYFVDQSYRPTRFARFLLSEGTLEERRQTIPKLKRLKRYLDKKLQSDIDFIEIFDSPFRSVYVLQRT